MSQQWGPQVPEVDVDQLEVAMGRGAPVIDVRERDEYESGHVPGAVLIPMGEVVARVGEVSRDETVYVICGTGPRSARAVQWYLGQGIDAYNVTGGTKEWLQRGKRAVYGNEPG